MSWKCATYSRDKVIIEVSATTDAKWSANRFHTAASRLAVTTYEWLSFAVHKVFTQQDLDLYVQHSRHNVAPNLKQAEIAGKRKFNKVHTKYIHVHTRYKQCTTRYRHNL